MSVVDSDMDPDGWYTVKHPDDYICEHCREDEDMAMTFDRPGDEAAREIEKENMGAIMRRNGNE